jgi:ligand-binding SRPBCC domain-containing protein
MKIYIATPVQQSAEAVYQGFDMQLFKALAPSFPKLHILRFDGSRVGDEVHIALGIFGWKIRWDAAIIDYADTKEMIYFTDEGKQLPFFLKTWQHKHIMKRAGKGSMLIDDITFSSGWWLGDLLLYPVLYGQFYARKRVYQQYFSHKTN